MSVIRPNLPPAAAPAAAGPRLDEARLAAQRAFFAAALGQAPAAVAPAAALATPPPTSAATPVQKPLDPSAEPPSRVLRPGSLLDIRV